MTGTVVSIAGQPAPRTAHPPGPAAEAIVNIARLSEEESASRLFGFLTPRLAARFDPALDALTVRVDRAITLRAENDLVLTCRWGRLWESGDNEAAGWHPCALFFALRPSWRRRVFDALNPEAADGPARR
ncbi:MAG: hypothetical protein J0H82_26420 [Alphaproteobacteria bacterium]|nr:hypothetical protein [Alphaproteobacteria bacterium]